MPEFIELYSELVCREQNEIKLFLDEIASAIEEANYTDKISFILDTQESLEIEYNPQTKCWVFGGDLLDTTKLADKIFNRSVQKRDAAVFYIKAFANTEKDTYQKLVSNLAQLRKNTLMN